MAPRRFIAKSTPQSEARKRHRRVGAACVLAASAALLWVGLAAAEPPSGQPFAPGALGPGLVAPPQQGQDSERQDTGRQDAREPLVRGYFDAATSTFRAPQAAGGTVKRYATIRMVGTIDLNDAITADTSVSGFAELRTADGINSASFGGATVTRTGPHTASVDVSIPVTWEVPSGPVEVYADVLISASVTSADGATKTWFADAAADREPVRLPHNGDTLTLSVRGAL